MSLEGIPKVVVWAFKLVLLAWVVFLSILGLGWAYDNDVKDVEGKIQDMDYVPDCVGAEGYWIWKVDGHWYHEPADGEVYEEGDWYVGELRPYTGDLPGMRGLLVFMGATFAITAILVYGIHARDDEGKLSLDNHPGPDCPCSWCQDPPESWERGRMLQ